MRILLALTLSFAIGSVGAQVTTPKGVIDPMASPPVVMIQLDAFPIQVGRIDAVLMNCHLIGRVKPGTKQVNISVDGKLTGDGFVVTKVRENGLFDWRIPISQLDGTERSVRAWVPTEVAGKTVYLDNASATGPWKYQLKVARC